MSVVRPVADLNAEGLSLNSSDWNKNAGPKQGDQQKFVLNHMLLIRSRAPRCMGLFPTKW